MPAPSHPQLRLPGRAFRPVLVDLNSAMEHLGLESEVVLDAVDSGDLRWVWDVAGHPNPKPGRSPRRELRFWLGELLNPASGKSLFLPEVLTKVIGRTTEARLRAVTVGAILLLRRRFQSKPRNRR